MAGLVVVALVAGLLSLTSLSSSSDSDDAKAVQRNLEPFREAVDDLATAPGLRYKDTSAFGITENEITVTAAGSQFGSTSSGRSDNGRDVLRIDGKTFMRWQVDPAPREEAKEGEKAPPSEWSVGMDDGSELMDEALARTVAPSKLATALDEALTDVERSPPPANGSSSSHAPGQQSQSVNGTPALGVDTSAGRLLVTKEKPHRVLRLEAYDALEDLSDMRDQLENGKVPTVPRRVTTGPLASGDAEGMDLFPILTDTAADKMFDTLVEYTAQLEDATDRGITFTLDGAGEMNCGSSGCTATQNFTGEVSSIARKERVTRGKVTAVMSATFSIDGQPAGKCTSPQRTFPVRGNNVSGTLKCSNPGAGPLYSSVAARHKARAEADARACGCTVRYSIPLRANTLIDARALAKVEAKQLLDQARKERDNANCRTSTKAGTRLAAWHPDTNNTASPLAAPDAQHTPATSLAAATTCPDPTWGGRVKFLRDGQGRLHEMNAVLARHMLDKGTEANQRLRPPGFSGGAHNQARGHLLANRLGGSGDTLDNLFTITQNPTNSPRMRDYEGKIYDAVAAGEKVTYNVYLEYANSNAKIPKYIQLEAVGDRGFKLDVMLENPAHKQE